MNRQVIFNKKERVAYQQALKDTIENEIATNNELSEETERNLLTLCCALIKNNLQEEIPFFRTILASLSPKALEHFLEQKIAGYTGGNIVMFAAVNHHLFLKELVDLFTPKIPVRSEIPPVLPFEAYLRLIVKRYQNDRTIMHEVIELADDIRFRNESQKEYSNPILNLRLIIAPLRGLSKRKIMEIFQAEDRYNKTPMERCNSTQLVIIKRILGMFFVDRMVRLHSRYFIEMFDFLSIQELVEVFSDPSYSLNAIRVDNALRKGCWQFLTQQENKLEKFIRLVFDNSHYNILQVFFESIVPISDRFEILQMFLYETCDPLIYRDDWNWQKFRAKPELKEWIKQLPFAFIQKEKAAELVVNLLVYRKQRLNIADEYYNFFGINRGYSKTQKMAVVDKLLSNIFAQTPEKQAMFTKEELAILHQGRLGSLIAKWEKRPLGQRFHNSVECFTKTLPTTSSDNNIATNSSRYLY